MSGGGKDERPSFIKEVWSDFKFPIVVAGFLLAIGLVAIIINLAGITPTINEQTGCTDENCDGIPDGVGDVDTSDNLTRDSSFQREVSKGLEDVGDFVIDFLDLIALLIVLGFIIGMFVKLGGLFGGGKRKQWGLYKRRWYKRRYGGKR